MSSFIHPTAVVLGNVTLGDKVSIWPTAVVRGDSDRITIGDESNVQDGAVLHADENVPCTIGKRVTIGHRAIVHGATVEDECLIGMGAIVLNNAVIGKGSLIAAGALVTEGTTVPPNSVVIGIPGKRVWPVDDATRARILHGCDAYVKLAERHQRGEFKRVTT
jgi:carbonic anhydrase/acetyltransferase-like protein (isoleucine patch superfamily)